MTLQEELEKLFFNFSNRSYWFIRTFSGSFYEDFVQYNFVAIDNDNVRYQDIVNAKKTETKTKPAQKILADLIIKRNPQAKFHQVHAKALLDFCFNIKKNDIIFIPDDHGKLSFGIVQEQSVNLDLKKDDKVPYRLRRKIKWVEARRKYQLDAKVWPLFNSQKTVNNASKYSDYLNPALSSLYQNGQMSSLSLDVLTQAPIDARNFFTLGNDILDINDDLKSYFKLDSDNKVDVKLELKSPGSVELIAVGMIGIALLGLIIVGLSGGRFKFNMKKDKFEFNGEMETDGAIEKVNNYMNDGADRKVKLQEMQSKLQSIQLTDTKGDIAKVLGEHMPPLMLEEGTKAKTVEVGAPEGENLIPAEVPRLPKAKAPKKRKKK